MDAKSSVESHVLFDVREASLEGIGGIRDVQFGMPEVGEEVGKVPFHAVVGAPQSPARVVPAAGDFIDCPFLDERSPLVIPEFQPVRALHLADLRKKSHQCLDVLPCFEQRPPRHVPRDDGGLVEVAHLHGDGEALQQATPAVTDDCPHLPADCLQEINALLVCRDGLVWEKLPQEVLAAVWAAPHHDAEEVLEVRRVHDDDHLVRCQLLPLNLHSLQLPLHPLRAAAVLLCDLLVGLLAVGELLPNLLSMYMPLLAEFFAARFAFPELPTVVCSVLLEIGRKATMTYFS